MEQQRPSTRPRSKSSFSLRSIKSDKSAGSNALISTKPKVKLSGGESEADKRRKRLSDKSYADPSRAINEAQPAARNMLEGTTLLPLRDFQHKDVYGNAISDPDSSNPTRSRIERPLDTIRSFEAAIDAGFKRRNPIPRSETAPELNRQTDFPSRRSSVVDDESSIGGPRHGPRNNYGGQNGHGGQNGYGSQNGHGGYGPNGHYRPSPLRQNQERYSYGPSAYLQQSRSQRMGPAPPQQRGHSDFGTYHNHNYHDSYDTVQTGDSGASSEPWANSTAPSSDNSSIERMQHPRVSGDAYGVNHGGPYTPVSPVDNTIPEEYRPDDSTNYGPNPRYGSSSQQVGRTPPPGSMNGMNPGRYPQPPPHAGEQPTRNVIRLGEPQPPSQQPAYAPPQQGQWQPRPNQNMPMAPSHMASMGPPAPPSKDRRYAGQQAGKLQRQQRPPQAPVSPVKEKRKSWLKRLF